MVGRIKKIEDFSKIGETKISTQLEMHPHTKIKHDLLKFYLAAWYNIISSNEKHLIYLDGFAGPGIYDDGSEGSPIIALKCLQEHILLPIMLKKGKHFHFIFIEENQDSVNSLKNQIQKNRTKPTEQIDYMIIQGAFESCIDDIIKPYGFTNLPPTFAFIDPFGYSDFSMETLCKLMENRKCEVFINFMSGYINRFINADDWPEPLMDKLFGTNQWKPIKEMKGTENRLKAIRSLFRNQLIEKAQARYVLSFEMIGEHNQVIYDLVFATKSIAGLNAMKEAMWRVDPRGTNRFSDITDIKGQTFITTRWIGGTHWVPEAKKELLEHFRGLKVRHSTLQDYIIVETPYPYKKQIVNELRKEGVVKVERTGPRGGLLDETIIIFSS